MSCWVAPAIAAELWGLTLRDVQDMIRRGRLSTQSDGGFSFVQLPQYSRFNSPQPVGQRPATFSIVTPDELSALHQKPPEPPVVGNNTEAGGDHNNEDDLGPPPDEDPADNRIADWRAGRQSAAGRRKRPGSFLA